MNDLFVSTFEACSYIHDGCKNVLNESFPYNDINSTWCEAIIKKQKSKVIHVEKAADFALKWQDNYWHFTMTALDKMMLLLENGYDGKFFVFDKPYLRELLKLAGIPEEVIIFVKPDEHYLIKELHVLDDALNIAVHKELVQKVRKRILDNINNFDKEKYPERLYIRRFSPYKRLVKNEDEVLNYFKQYGFEAIFPDDYSVEEQIKYFCAADIVVSPHGGCSTNSLYMRENTCFVELFGFNYVNPCMLDIIKDNKMCYNMIVEKGDYDTIPESPNSSYNVDLKLLDDVLYRYLNSNQTRII